MSRIRRALISVSDKTGLVPFALQLVRLGVEIVSTGGTAKALRDQGVRVREIERFTGFPEILDGRVKTLHPKVHGGILADRSRKEHQRQSRRHGLEPIDLVVVNLYPFEQTAGRRGVSWEEMIEQIDIGGVALLRSAAKNFRSVAVVSRPAQYAQVLEELRRGKGALSDETRLRLAVEAFSETAYYDSVIHQALAHRESKTGTLRYLVPKGGLGTGGGVDKWPEKMVLAAARRQVLRYGENPHQGGVWYQWPAVGGAAGRRRDGRPLQLHGKELSFNNLLDLDAAVRLVSAFRRPCAAILKHNNPCGVACAGSLDQAFRRAQECDPLSSFGGIVGLNRVVDRAAAQAILAGGFLECVVAPGFKPEALQALRSRKNLRIVQDSAAQAGLRRCVDLKQVGSGLLAQDPDEFRRASSRWRVVAGSKPTAAQMKDLLFAWTVARFARSNAIVIARGEQTVGIGAGFTSRVDSVRFAVQKAGKRARGAVLASDGFFPKPDGPQAAVRAGIRAIAQPGGSAQDPEVTRVARKGGVTMLMTGERHFFH
ncbi:MAG: bifunctional phosphoribosylaminoimidazolecarboxamide formyltransferase/IMP cyclohydrolase [Candidatus Omnitrophica bacterium]|nr:bifunctional phosphoribosylaminoimidazolecarboxamide formyltransferase/IMP cyclohydrolase [Candidatus Omnitrophota bacterium]